MKANHLPSIQRAEILTERRGGNHYDLGVRNCLLLSFMFNISQILDLSLESKQKVSLLFPYTVLTLQTSFKPLLLKWKGQ